MALRRSSIKLRRRRRRSRGGIYIPYSKPKLYDLEYRQKTEDYRDGVISFDEYIKYLEDKLKEFPEGTSEHFTIKKRIKDVTNAYNKKLEAERRQAENLERRKMAEDYRDGLIGYAVYSEYLSKKLDSLDPNSLDYFIIKKQLDNITQQHIEKQVDFGFKVAKTIEPDDYIKFKEEELQNVDPNSDKYIQIQKDIREAEREKIRREELKLKFDIQQQTKNKMDLAKFYLDIAQNSDDPEMQMMYYNKYVSTVDSINREALSEYNKRIAIQDRDMFLKYKRGDLGNTFEENLRNYYNYLNNRLETEPDINKQFTLISRIDSLVREANEFQEQRTKLAEKQAKAIKKEGERSVREKIRELRKEFYRNKANLDKMLSYGWINAKQYAVEMIKMTNSYKNDLVALASSPYITESAYDRIESELEGINKHQENDNFWKAVIPVRDKEGNFTGEVYFNPNYKAVQKPSNYFKTTWEFDPTQSYEKKNYVYDPKVGVWREIAKRKVKDASGKSIERYEIYRLDENGNVLTEYQTPQGDWGFLGKDGKFIRSDRNYRNVDFKLMTPDDIERYQKETKENVWKEVAKEEGMLNAMLQRHLVTHPEAPISKLAEMGGDVKKVADYIVNNVSNVPQRIQKDFSRESFARLPEDFSKIVEAASGLKIGETGEHVKELQKNLRNLGYYRKGITGYFGPKTMEAVNEIKNKIAQDFSKESFARLPQDIGTIGKAIGTAASRLFKPNYIGGALGEVYAKRKDLQKVFDPTGKGKGEWAGKTIEDWARMYGYKEEPLLKSYAPKPPVSVPKLPKLSLPKFTLPKISVPKISIPEPAQKAATAIQKTYNPTTFSRLPKDIGTISKAVTKGAGSYLEGIKKKVGGFLNKLKWW